MARGVGIICDLPRGCIEELLMHQLKITFSGPFGDSVVFILIADFFSFFFFVSSSFPFFPSGDMNHDHAPAQSFYPY